MSPQCEQRTRTQKANERINRKTKGSFCFVLFFLNKLRFSERCQLQCNQLFYAKKKKKKKGPIASLRVQLNAIQFIGPAGVAYFSTPQFLIFLPREQCFCQDAASVVPYVMNRPQLLNPERFVLSGRPEYIEVRRSHKFSSRPLEGTVNNVKR